MEQVNKGEELVVKKLKNDTGEMIKRKSELVIYWVKKFESSVKSQY